MLICFSIRHNDMLSEEVSRPQPELFEHNPEFVAGSAAASPLDKSAGLDRRRIIRPPTGRLRYLEPAPGTKLSKSRREVANPDHRPAFPSRRAKGKGMSWTKTFVTPGASKPQALKPQASKPQALNPQALATCFT